MLHPSNAAADPILLRQPQTIFEMAWVKYFLILRRARIQAVDISDCTTQ